jgi:predicted transcriptional regulator
LAGEDDYTGVPYHIRDRIGHLGEQQVTTTKAKNKSAVQIRIEEWSNNW